jgi:hypothetical protein
MIGYYLENKYLAKCALVCKSWNQSFAPLIYHDIYITDDKLSVSYQVIQKYAIHTKSLSYSGIIDANYYTIPFNNLKSIRLGCKYRPQTEYGDAILISNMITGNKRTLNHFEIFLQPLPSFKPIWSSIIHCHNLRSMSFMQVTFDLDGIELLLNACSMVTSLRFSSVNIVSDTKDFEFQHFPTRLPNLKSLHISSPKNRTFEFSLGILKRTINLNNLNIYTDRHSSIGDTPTVTNLYREIMSSNIFNQLNYLDLVWELYDGNNIWKMGDEDVAITINSMNQAKIIFCQTEFSNISYQALMGNHTETIRELHILHCPGVTGAMVQGILSRCPLLESFVAAEIRGSDLIQIEYDDQDNSSISDSISPSLKSTTSSESIILSPDWVCTRLSRLTLFFDMSSSDTGIDCSTHEGEARFKRQQQLEQKHAFRQLSRLTSLEDLDMRNWSNLEGNNSKPSLEFKLKSSGGEMEQLNALKNIRYITISDVNGNVGSEERVWMKKQWHNPMIQVFRE